MTEDLAITPRMIVQAMCDTEANPVDVEEVREVLRRERLVEVPRALAARKKRNATIRAYCRVLWGIIAAAIPLSIAKEIWPDLWLTWTLAAVIWSVIVATMLALFFLLTKEEKRNADVWTIGSGGTHG